MTEKQQHNDTSQGRCGGIVYYYFVTNLLLSLPWDNF